MSGAEFAHRFIESFFEPAQPKVVRVEASRSENAEVGVFCISPHVIGDDLDLLIHQARKSQQEAVNHDLESGRYWGVRANF